MSCLGGLMDKATDFYRTFLFLSRTLWTMEGFYFEMGFCRGYEGGVKRDRKIGDSRMKMGCPISENTRNGSARLKSRPFIIDTRLARTQIGRPSVKAAYTCSYPTPTWRRKKRMPSIIQYEFLPHLERKHAATLPDEAVLMLYGVHLHSATLKTLHHTP